MVDLWERCVRDQCIAEVFSRQPVGSLMVSVVVSIQMRNMFVEVRKMFLNA
jgi:hypothetical protein